MALAVAAACRAAEPPPARPSAGVLAFVGATLIDGTGAPPVANATLVVRDGRIVAVGRDVDVPADAERVDVRGRTIVPGFINAHGHVGETRGLESGPAFNTPENVRRQLEVYARYGVTAVVSLGGDGEAGFRARDDNWSPKIARARLFVAGPVVTSETPTEARAAVDLAADRNPDWIKIRVDDNLGTAPKMQPEVYRAVIAQAHQRGLRVAAHVFYLADAKDLLRVGVDLLAHSVRDREVDAELIALMQARGVCLSPTLMREVSTFVYESRPPFFDDPFFRRGVDPEVVAALEDPAAQARVRTSRAAQRYKRALEVARRNVKTLAEAGAGLAMGTDTGPPGRFQGYFEHLELEELVRAGLSPMQTIVAATGAAARCLGVDDRLGTLAPGRAADFLVLAASPLEDIRNTRRIESVWIAGHRVTP